jgi:hypothetical protein
MEFKEHFEDYTESEFLEFLRDLFEGGRDLSDDDFDAYIIKGVLHFEAVTEHPDGSDVILHPKDGQEDSPERILKEVKEWRALNNKPGFKPE